MKLSDRPGALRNASTGAHDRAKCTAVVRAILDRSRPKSSGCPAAAPLAIRGRKLTAATLDTIKRCVAANYDRGRTHISVVVCRRLRWRQPNGWLKDRACRDVLLRLEARGIIELPPRCHKQSSQRRSARLGRPIFKGTDHIQGDLVLVWAKGNQFELTWNRLVSKYHYLGHKVIVGRCIKYLVKQGDKIIAAISFSSPAWGLEKRNKILSELGLPPWELRDLVINNSRYLLLSRKGTANLASRILAFATSRIAEDWQKYYGVRPHVVETFVEPTRFEGTCYKAANWILVGRTRGFRKKGNAHVNSQLPKLLFLYGLNSRVRRQLFALNSNLCT
jgi:hypothetical protein